jgi:hypothetical protein
MAMISGRNAWFEEPSALSYYLPIHGYAVTCHTEDLASKIVTHPFPLPSISLKSTLIVKFSHLFMFFLFNMAKHHADSEPIQ